MSGNGRKLPNTAYRFTVRLPEFSNHEHNEEMDKRKPGDLAWTGSNPPETIILSIHISESKVWSERKTMIVRQINVGFGKSQLSPR